MKKIILFAVLTLTFAFFLTACQKENQAPVETPETVRIKHAEIFAKIQNYVNTHYSPEWKVKGVRISGVNLNGVQGLNSYYVLLSKDQTEKIISLIVAEFELTDGTTETQYFELPDSTRTNEK